MRSISFEVYRQGLALTEPRHFFIPLRNEADRTIDGSDNIHESTRQKQSLKNARLGVVPYWLPS